MHFYCPATAGLTFWVCSRVSRGTGCGVCGVLLINDVSELPCVAGSWVNCTVTIGLTEFDRLSLTQTQLHLLPAEGERLT